MKGESLKIGLIGANGKMGKAISSLTDVIPILRGDSLPTTCDVFIHVASSESLFEHLPLITKPVVIGVTNLNASHYELMEKTAKRVPLFYSPNFSLALLLVTACARQIASQFEADIDLIETHHAEKKDAPSGTALHLAKALQKPVKIHSLRSGKVVGEHTLFFNNGEEKITLSHTAHSREAFARGAIKAANFLAQKSPGLYDMEDLL